MIYLDEKGARITDPEAVARCRELVIPPAWRDTVAPPPSMVGGELRTRGVLSPWVALLGRPGLNEAMAELDGWVLGAAGSADELRDVMTEPFAGVEITAKVDGEFLGAARFEPFWAAAEETGALVFVHPTTRGFAGPDEHYLWNTVGNPLETMDGETIDVHAIDRPV